MKIGFGKYRGRSVDDVAIDDPAYLQWLLTQDWIWVELRTEIEDLLGLDTEKMGRATKLLIDKVSEALQTKGYSDVEAQQKVKRFMKLTSESIDALMTRGHTFNEAKIVLSKLAFVDINVSNDK